MTTPLQHFKSIISIISRNAFDFLKNLIARPAPKRISSAFRRWKGFSGWWVGLFSQNQHLNSKTVILSSRIIFYRQKSRKQQMKAEIIVKKDNLKQIKVSKYQRMKEVWIEANESKCGKEIKCKAWNQRNQNK